MSVRGLLLALHRWSGVVLAAALLLYAGTGFVITHGSWFGSGRSSERRELALEARGLEGDALGRRVGRELGLRGRPEPPRRAEDGGWELVWRRPGALERVRVDPEGARAEHVREREGPARTLAQLHQLHGWRGGLRHLAWAALLDGVALAMLLFPASGIWLWWRLRRDRLGWLLLGAGAAYAAGSLAWLLVAR